MTNWMIRLLPFLMPAVLLLAGCQPKTQSFLPITGANEVSYSVQVELARDNVLDYVLASSRLANLPAKADWQLDAGEKSESAYRFRSGDWLMLIWLAETEDGNRRVIIINKLENASWFGYVTSDGRVIDTAYGR